MKSNRLIFRYIVLFLLVSLLLTSLTGCRRQIIEKVGVLPDRPTQFVAHNTETEAEEQEGKSWDVQNVDELRLYSTEIEVTETPSSHYYNNTAYLHRTFKQDPGQTIHSFERLKTDGTLTALHSMVVSENNDCCYSPDGTVAAYSTWIDGCLTLMLVDLRSNEQSVLWQSDEASLLKELGLSVRLHWQWSADGSTLLFMPICFTDSNSVTVTDFEDTENSTADFEVTEDSTTASETEPQTETTSETEPQTETTSAPATDEATDSIVPSDSIAPSDPISLSTTEKMQLVYESLPNFPLIYIYQLNEKQLQSFLIAFDDYPLYDAETAPMTCTTEDGSQFFIYFNSPANPALSHYIDINNMIHYSTPLTTYLPSFTQLGSAPMFSGYKLYLHVDGVGIMILDPASGSVTAQYPFNDPIHSFTIYDNALIVAQPSDVGSGGGVDVTAYLLNLETKQSVLLYHNSDTHAPFINHMEMSQDGYHLLIEQLPSEYRNQKQLIQLSFN